MTASWSICIYPFLRWSWMSVRVTAVGMRKTLSSSRANDDKVALSRSFQRFGEQFPIDPGKTARGRGTLSGCGSAL